MYRNKQILNSKLFYDDKEDKFYSSKPDYKNGGYTKRELEAEPERFGEVVYEMALKRPGEWIGPRLGAPGVDEAPNYLCTDVPTLFQQGKKPYCLAYSLASALWYCELYEQAQWVAESAESTSKKEFDDQLNDLLEAMKNFVPLIGSATRFGVKTKGHKREKRDLTWHELFNTLTPYPTIVVPIRPNGDYSHAFCVIDDLIFDSSTPFALKLNMESVKWIFQNDEVELWRAYRFGTKCSPPKHKIYGEWDHKVQLHWDRSDAHPHT